jgi:lipopolysaccharide transport system permease protein
MSSKDWDEIITSENKWLSFNLGELYRYKDLIFLFVKRDFVSVYKQTMLGPLWFFIQPIFQTIIFGFVFGKMGGMGAGDSGIPDNLFFMAGVVSWAYFADCLTKTSETFVANEKIFGKVYFPRLIAPLSIIISNLIKFGIQFLLFVVIYIVYVINNPSIAQLNWSIVLIPFYILLMAMIGLGTGLVITSLTTKYRDLRFLVGFGVQLLMYVSTVITSFKILETKEASFFTYLIKYNPISYVIEGFRFSFLGPEAGSLNYFGLLYASVVSIVILFVGLVFFNKEQKSFMDTV